MFSNKPPGQYLPAGAVHHTDEIIKVPAYPVMCNTPLSFLKIVIKTLDI
jgi:hypothetical protein